MTLCILILFSLILFNSIYSTESAHTLFDKYTPDYGFSSIKGTLGTKSCFIPEQIIYHQKVTNSFSQLYLYEELIKELSLSKEITFPSYIFPNNNLAQYLNSIKSTRLTYSLSFVAIKYQQIELKYNTLTRESFINEEGLSSLSESQDKLFRDCGDQLVDSYDEGILLIMSFNLIFHTVEKQIQFVNSLESKKNEISNENIIEKLNEITKDFHLKGTIEFTSIQIGGNYTMVNYEDITRCLFHNMEKCKTRYDDLQRYSKLINIQYDNHPLDRRPLTRYNKRLLYKMNEDFKEPILSVSENVKTIREKLFNAINKYSYYDQFLFNFKYYPVEIESIMTYLNKVKTNLNKINNLNPITCFEDISLCDEFDTLLNSFDNDLEDNIMNLIDSMKTYDIIIINLKDDLFLTGEGTGNLPKFQWDSEYPVYIYILPIDNNEYKWTIESEAFEVANSSNDISDLSKIEFNVNEGFFKFKITLLRNHKNEKEFKVIVNDEEKKIIKHLKIPLTVQNNPFYFSKYNQ